MEDRIRRLSDASVPKLRANAGSNLLISVSHPVMGKMRWPVHWNSFTPRKYCSRAPTIKLGTDTPIMATSMLPVSHAVPRFTAATMPSSTPITAAKINERMPSSNE